MYYSHLKTIPRGAFVDLINASPRARQPDYHPLSYSSFLRSSSCFFPCSLHKPLSLLFFFFLPFIHIFLFLPMYMYIYIHINGQKKNIYISPFLVSVAVHSHLCFRAGGLCYARINVRVEPSGWRKIKPLFPLCSARAHASVHLHDSRKHRNA